MIKEVLQQLEPLDAQIDALCSRADDAEMASTTTHAAELAELSAEENTLLQRCTSLTLEDRVFLAAALTILPPADAPVTPTLEVISPELTAVRLRRMLAAVFMKAGRELDAEMELALLPVEARSL